MNTQPFDAAEVIQAVGIRLAQLRQSVDDRQQQVDHRLELFEAQIHRSVAERLGKSAMP